MTNRQTLTKLRPEHTESLRITGCLPGLIRELPMPNGTCADLAGPTLIAEIEPRRRWQTGLAQLLEYWDQALRTPRPILLIIEDGTNTREKDRQRLERLANSLSVTVWTWEPNPGRFTRGGSTAIPEHHDFAPLLTWTGSPWTAAAEPLRACQTQREPYRTWRRVYEQRDRNRPKLTFPPLQPPTH